MKIELPQQAWDFVVAALAELPAKNSMALIVEIQRQATAEVEAEKAAAADAGAGADAAGRTADDDPPAQ